MTEHMREVDVDYRTLLPARARDAHKYSHGTVLVVAGSASYPGAAVLATRAAQRSGAGYVTLATPVESARVALCHLLSAPVLACASDGGAFGSEAAAELVERSRRFDAVVLGPGITSTPGTAELVRALLERYPGPIVLDADALTIVSENPAVLDARSAPTVLTPHAGEARRLAEGRGGSRESDAVSSCRASAGHGRIVVSKGPGTVTCDGGRWTRCPSGSAALATAGTGDVLSGVIGALLAQGIAPFEAAATGVYVHGRAGERAEARLGMRSVIAEDVLEELPYAFLEAI